MSQSFDSLSSIPFERKLSGGARVFLGFLAGAVVALLPIYYFYMGRDVALRANPPAGVSALPTSTAEPPRRAQPAAPAEPSNRFASRMTYELSQLPEELPVSAVKEAAPMQSAAASRIGSRMPEPQRPAARETEESSPAPAAKVANARPISATPPDARDTTREIEKEARRPEYREPPARRQAKAASEPVRPRVIEGRDLIVPPTSAAQDKDPVESRAVVAAGPPVAGVTPISPPPETPQRAAPPQGATAPPAAAKGAAAASTQAPGAADDVVESRLVATREWLAAAPQGTHTIQIMGANNPEQLKAHLKALSKLLEPTKLYVFRTIAQGKPSTTVVYGAYADRQAALQALEKLPASLAANRPLLRTVNGIRAELKQHGK